MSNFELAGIKARLCLAAGIIVMTVNKNPNIINNMKSTYERSLMKGIVWEGFSFLLTLLAVYLVYGDFAFSIKFSLVFTVIKVVLFFIHERIWKDITWGTC